MIQAEEDKISRVMDMTKKNGLLSEIRLHEELYQEGGHYSFQLEAGDRFLAYFAKTAQSDAGFYPVTLKGVFKDQVLAQNLFRQLEVERKRRQIVEKVSGLMGSHVALITNNRGQKVCCLQKPTKSVSGQKSLLDKIMSANNGKSKATRDSTAEFEISKVKENGGSGRDKEKGELKISQAHVLACHILIG